MNISKDAWKEVLDVLKKHKITYTTHYERRDIPRATECSDATVQDKYIQINLVILDYFDECN